MKDQGSVTRLLARLRSEDDPTRDEAAALIWGRYCDVLLDLACRHLDQRLRRRVGEDDVVQRTFQSFFLRHRRGEYALADRSDLLRLLVRMTQNKTRGAATREARLRRDYRRDQALAAPDATTAEDAWVAERVEQGGPTPTEAAELAEEAERRLGRLPEDLRRIALWKLEGYTNEGIAALPEMRCTVRTVERKLRLIREAWDGPA